MQVEVTGEDVPNPIFSFDQAALDPKVAANVVRCHYKKPTPVQKYAIPIGLARRDLMACAQTGSGKTAAFCFSIISCILISGMCPCISAPMAKYQHADHLQQTHDYYLPFSSITRYCISPFDDLYLMRATVSMTCQTM